MLEPIPDDVRYRSRVLIEAESRLVGIPLDMYAMWGSGAFADWCVADDRGMFKDYYEQGAMIVFRSRQTSLKWLLHPVTGQFCDTRNRPSSWRGFLMRNPEIAGGILSVLEDIADRNHRDLTCP